MKKIILLLALLIITISYSYALPECYCVNGEPVHQPTCVIVNNFCAKSPATCTVNCNNAICGNNIIEGAEQCDYNEAIPKSASNLNGKTCQLLGLGFTAGNLACNVDCTFNTDQCTTCGDGSPELPEECDKGSSGNGDCPKSCSNTCEINVCPASLVCGDGICSQNENTEKSCLADCGYKGWNTVHDVWFISDKNQLTAKGQGVIYSDSFDLKLGSTYTFSGKIFGTNCGKIDLYNGQCLSGKDWTDKSCFPNAELPVTGGNAQINIKFNQHNVSGYLKDVRIRITATAACAFDDISLKDITNGIEYSLPTELSSVSSCCPLDYCWNGTGCINSNLWTTNSKYPPIWNNIFNIRWLNAHVNASNSQDATGYRCVMNDDGIAEWIPAQIKYDWDFNESGYCNKQSDCFVGKGQSYGNDASCIANRSFVNDSGVIENGNHYCYDGSWTTRTHIIATAMQNFTQKPFILYCDTQERISNDVQKNIELGNGCTMIIKEDVKEEQVILGINVENTSNNHSLDVITTMVKNFAALVTDDDVEAELYKHLTSHFQFDDQDDCAKTSNSQYRLCVDYTGKSDDNPGLFIYYNNQSHYILVSDRAIKAIDQTFLERVWGSIKNFFLTLFRVPSTSSYTIINRTANYDRIYLLKNNSLTVNAIEEAKYDEYLSKIMTYMYIDYNGTSDNTLNIDYINKTLQPLTYDYNINKNRQGIILIYNNPNEIWPYLTAMLRDR